MKYAIVFVLILVAALPSSALPSSSSCDVCEQDLDLCEGACMRGYVDCAVCTQQWQDCISVCSGK